MLINRRTLLAGVGAGVAMPGLGISWQTRASAKARQTRITHAVTSLAYIHSYVAEQNGYFRESGLSTQLIDTNGGGPDVQLVLGGRAEATVNDGAQILPALQEGQKLTCVMSLISRSIVNVTMSKRTAERLGVSESTPMTEKLKKLKGLKLGVTRAGALTWQLARFNLVNAGLNPDTDAQVVAIGGPPALAAALSNGAIDAIYISMPIGERLVREGTAVTYIDNAKGEDPKLAKFMMEGLWATPGFIAANTELVSAIVNAYRKANDFIVKSSTQAIVDAVKPALGSLGDAVLSDAVNRMKPAISENGLLDQGELDATQDVLALNGFLKNRFALSDVFESRFIKS